MLQKGVVCSVLLLLSVAVYPASGIEVGERLIPFAGETLTGTSINLEKVIGEQPVMLIFWASWCPNCKSEVPKINQLFKKFGARMFFLGVNVGYNDSRRRASRFIKQAGMRYPVYYDETRKVTTRYRIHGVPTIVIANTRGVVTRVLYAAPDLDEDELARLEHP